MKCSIKSIIFILFSSACSQMSHVMLTAGLNMEYAIHFMSMLRKFLWFLVSAPSLVLLSWGMPLGCNHDYPWATGRTIPHPTSAGNSSARFLDIPSASLSKGLVSGEQETLMPASLSFSEDGQLYSASSGDSARHESSAWSSSVPKLQGQTASFSRGLLLKPPYRLEAVGMWCKIPSLTPLLGGVRLTLSFNLSMYA